MKLKFLLMFGMAMIASLAMGSAASAFLGTNALLTSGVVLGFATSLSLSTLMPVGSFGSTAITKTLLDSEFGAHYSDGSKSERDLHTKLFYGSKFDKLFQLTYTKLSKYDQGLVTSSEITQAYQDDFTDNGTITFKPSVSYLQRLKVDMKPSSYMVRESFVGFLRKEGVPEDQQPLIAWLMNNIVVKQHIQDVELKACYKGVFATPTPGTAGAAINAIDGVKFKINAAITASTITPIVTGAMATDAQDFVEQIEAFADGIDPLDRSQPMTLAMSVEQARLFARGMRVKYNSQHLQVEDLTRILDYNNIQVEGFEAMSGSTKVFCTPAENALKLINITDQMGGKSQFNFEVVDRKIKIWMDYALAYHFIDPSRVYTNDVELS